MSAPSAPPARPGLGPPPSLDGLSALLQEGRGNGSGGGGGGTGKPPLPPLPLPPVPPTSTSHLTNGLAKMNIGSSSSPPTTRHNGADTAAASGSKESRSSSSSAAMQSPNHPHNLRKLAKTSVDPTFSIKSYIGAANALLEKAKSSDAQGQAEQAFVNYLKAGDVAANITKHADWPRTLEQRGQTFLRYQEFMKNVPFIVQRGHRLEEHLKAREEGRAEEASRKVPEIGLQSSTVSSPPSTNISPTQPSNFSPTPPNNFPRPAIESGATQITDARAKRQAMYIPSPTPPPSLIPGNSAGQSSAGLHERGFAHSSSYGSGLEIAGSPSMPARTYQSAGANWSPGNSVLTTPPANSHAKQPHIPTYANMSAAQSFDYPQLNVQPQRMSYNDMSVYAPTPPAAAAATTSSGLPMRAPLNDVNGRTQSMDLSRRPPIPSPSPYGAGALPLTSAGGHQHPGFQQVGARSTPMVPLGMTGLKNVGNSCYMNSTLQCISATIPVAMFMLDGSYKKAINRLNPLGTQGALVEAFAQLIRVMWSERYTFVSPDTFRDAIVRFAPSFRGYDQHDAQEFLAFLLDGLHEDLNYVKQKPPPVEMTPERERELETLPQQLASVKEWLIYRARNDSLIVDWFQGQFRSKLVCLSCGTTSTTYNAFMYLSLPIPAAPKGVRVSLTQCLDAFTREEVLEKADAWHCPHCNKPRRATKRLTISRLPQVLLIHLKRFSFKGPYTDKIETNVSFPTSNLDLTNYMPPPLPPNTVPRGVPVSTSQQPPYVYDLYGVTHHFGNLSSGHYTATVRAQDDNGKPQWKYCDDSRIVTSDEREIHSSSSYILFFHRKDPKRA